MSVKRTILLMGEFMKANPTYRPDSLTVSATEPYVRRLLKKHQLSDDLTLNGVKLHCIGTPEWRARHRFDGLPR